MTEARIIDYLNEYHSKSVQGSLFQDSSNLKLEEQKLLIEDFIKYFSLDKSVDSILDQRAKTHGDFRDHALLAQSLKDKFYELKSNRTLTSTQMEALEMIFHKIARIGAGNPNEVDHWQDIAGYATLVAKELDDTNGI